MVPTRRGPVRIAFTGAGPAALMLLERIVANHEVDAAGLPLHIDLIDPHEPGSGRIWRRDQSPLLKLNTLVGDDAVFTDDSCQIDGPIRPGPSLEQWIAMLRSGRVARPSWWDDTLEREVESTTTLSFPTRRLNNAYLGWAFEEVLRRKRPEVTVAWHHDRARRVEEAPGDGEATIILEGGERLHADIVVYLMGHNGSALSAESARLADFADRHGLVYIPPAFTAEADLSSIRAGSDVIVRGMGLAAVDLVVLLTAGRGGRYERVDGRLRYIASGEEPVLHLGSRRGVPYRSKITTSLAGEPVALEYLGPDFRERLAGRTGVEFDVEVLPLVIAELITGYYRELFTAHPEHVAASWAEFSSDLRRALAQPGGHRSPEFRRLIEDTVPEPEDRFDFDAFDRPLDHLPFGADGATPDTAVLHGAAEQEEDLQRRVLDHIATDLRHRTEQGYSATQGLFLTALVAFMSIAEVPREVWATGGGESRFRVSQFASARFSGFFSYLASGPPAHRLEEFLALADAGLLRFLGGHVELVADEADGRFRASGQALTEHGLVRAHATAHTLVDAWLPEANVATSDNALIRDLLRDGLRREGEGGPPAVGLGQILVTPEARLPGRRRRFAIGPYTSIFSGAFTRPGTNAISFRRFDHFARAILEDAEEFSSARNETRTVADVRDNAHSIH